MLAATTLADPAARKALYDGGSAAVAASMDPLIMLARAVLDFIQNITHF